MVKSYKKLTTTSNVRSIARQCDNCVYFEPKSESQPFALQTCAVIHPHITQP